MQIGAKRDKGVRPEQNRHRVAPSCQTDLMSAPGPTGKRQEHLNAIVSFAGAGYRRRQFRELHILTIKRATGDLPDVDSCSTRN